MGSMEMLQNKLFLKDDNLQLEIWKDRDMSFLRSYTNLNFGQLSAVDLGCFAIMTHVLWLHGQW